MISDSGDFTQAASAGSATAANDDPKSGQRSFAIARDVDEAAAQEPYEPTLGQLLDAYLAEHAVP